MDYKDRTAHFLNCSTLQSWERKQKGAEKEGRSKLTVPQVEIQKTTWNSQISLSSMKGKKPYVQAIAQQAIGKNGSTPRLHSHMARILKDLDTWCINCKEISPTLIFVLAARQSFPSARGKFQKFIFSWKTATTYATTWGWKSLLQSLYSFSASEMKGTYEWVLRKSISSLILHCQGSKTFLLNDLLQKTRVLIGNISERKY